jgi:hypothetical protein
MVSHAVEAVRTRSGSRRSKRGKLESRCTERSHAQDVYQPKRSSAFVHARFIHRCELWVGGNLLTFSVTPRFLSI